MRSLTEKDGADMTSYDLAKPCRRVSLLAGCRDEAETRPCSEVLKGGGA